MKIKGTIVFSMTLEKEFEGDPTDDEVMERFQHLFEDEVSSGYYELMIMDITKDGKEYHEIP